MTNELTPAPETPSFISELIEDLNLPALIAGDAGKAFSRLVGGVIDIPAALLNEKTQAIKDRTEARSAVTKAIAERVAKIAGENPEIVDQAVSVLVTKEFRKFENKSAVAAKLIEHLKDEPLKVENRSGGKSRESGLDDDWLNVFERYAEDASSERLRDLWGRVIAGEIRKPKSFSLKTMRFIAELDKRTAELFEKYVGQVVANNLIPHMKGAQVFGELLELQDAGLLQGVGGTYKKNISLTPDSANSFAGIGLIAWGEKFIYVKGEPGLTLDLWGMVVTKVGVEVASIIKKPIEIGVGEYIAETLPKEKLELIALGSFTAPSNRFQIERVLWPTDAATPSA